MHAVRSVRSISDLKEFYVNQQENIANVVAIRSDLNQDWVDVKKLMRVCKLLEFRNDWIIFSV